MRYVNVFCGRYSLASGCRVIAWFYIVLYLINIIINILADDIVKSFKENVDDATDYDKNKLLTVHYISLTFGVVTILLSAAFLVKFSESEDFVHFMVKWNVVRCLFCFGAILYVSVDMHHLLTVALSSLMLIIDLCASTYFTGVLASYIKQLDDPSGEVYSTRQSDSGEPAVYLVSHKRSLHGENKVSYVNEVSKTGPDGFGETPRLNDGVKTSAEVNHDIKETTSYEMKTTEKDTSGEDYTNQKSSEQHQQQLDIKREEIESRGSNEKSGLDYTHLKDNTERGGTPPELDINSKKPGEDPNKTGAENPTALSEKSNDTGIEDPVLSEKSGEDQSIENSVPSEKSSDDKGRENPVAPSQKSSDDEGVEGPVLSEKLSDDNTSENAADLSEKWSDDKERGNPVVDVSEIALPSLVIIPASPDEELMGNLGNKKDTQGTDNPVFDADE